MLPEMHLKLTPGAAALALLVAAALAAVPARAASPWENIANMLTARRSAQQAVTSVTAQRAILTEEDPVPPVSASARPALREVPDEVALNAASMARPAAGSAASALASLNLTTAAVAMKAAAKAPDAKTVALGLESDENEAMLATDLFKKKDIRRLLGDEPRFIYDPAQRPDPMVVPWVRRAAIFKELAALADTYTNQGEFDKAVEVYKRILEMHDPRFSDLVHTKLAAIAEKQNAAAVAIMTAQAATEELIELPAWVTDNTTGVIVSPGREMCLVGEYMLKTGDPVPNYPEVRVTGIAPRKVTYQIKNKTFDVELKTN